jgi:hypothetical protein
MGFFENIAATSLAKTLPPETFVRRSIDLYLQGAGVEAGYGFFAPTVAGQCKLMFQVFYADESNETVLPFYQNESTKLRLFDVLEQLDRVDYPPLRELVLRTTTSNVWLTHPGATRVRVIFGRIDLPTLSEYRDGKKADYEPLFAYDYEYAESPSP